MKLLKCCPFRLAKMMPLLDKHVMSLREGLEHLLRLLSLMTNLK